VINYRGNRYIIDELLPSETDNGVTVMLEAMAMGKPVICRRTGGQVDVIVDGANGLSSRKVIPLLRAPRFWRCCAIDSSFDGFPAKADGSVTAR
jgi:hypothetical protein